MQSSGDAGIVVFTLGSFITNITMEKANMIASALAQIPQKVSEIYSQTRMNLNDTRTQFDGTMIHCHQMAKQDTKHVLNCVTAEA